MNSLQQKGIARTKLVVFLAAAILGVVMIAVAYLTLHDPHTPVRKTGDTFMNALVKGDATTTYNLFTDNYKKNMPSGSWTSELHAAAKNYKDKAKFVKTETIPDPYHVYKSYAEPTRLTYSLKVNGKTYLMSLVMLKSSNDPKTATWQVDEWGSRFQ